MGGDGLGVLEVLDLRVERGRPRLTRERVVAPIEDTLDVAPIGAGVPDGFVATSNGALCYRKLDGVSSVVRRVHLERHAGDVAATDEIRYRWTDVATSGAQLAVLVLPGGYRLAAATPPPVAAMVAGERLVVVWARPTKAISFEAAAFDGAPAAAAERIDRESPTRGKLPRLSGVRWIEPGAKRHRFVRAGVAGVVTIAIVAFWATRSGEHDPVRPAPRERPGITERYTSSHALVVGVDAYPSERWTGLAYATKDAEGMASFLAQQGFEVTTLLDAAATKHAILRHLENELAPRLLRNDRVLFFFAGHGHTRELGGNRWGYIVPYDAGDDSASYISMDKLRELSLKMNEAKHQLFILDACFGGLIATTAGTLDPQQANYIEAVMRRPARQVLSAGGKTQQVVDGYGPAGYGLFTGTLLEALERNLADDNGDGFVTVSELFDHARATATTDYQSPYFATLAGHGMGEFVFDLRRRAVESEGSHE